MSVDVAVVVAADKATTEAATPGPWHIEESSWDIPGSEEVDRILCGPTPTAGPPRDGIAEVFGIETGLQPHHANEAFLIAARERWPVYIAAIEAVTEMEERFAEIGHNGHEQWEGEPECPGCVAADLRRALAVLAPSTDKEQQ